MNKKGQTNFSGLLLGLLTILFVGLKLGGVINWSWWWVLSPIWIPIVFALILIISLFIYIKTKIKNAKPMTVDEWIETLNKQNKKRK